MNLNELEQLYREIESRLDEEDFDPEALLAALGEQVERKVNAYCFVIGKLLAREQWAKEEAKRLQEIATTAQNEAARLRGHLLWFLEQRGMEKLTTDRYRVSVTHNGGKPPLIIDENVRPEDVPDAFRRVKYEFNLDAIRAEIETISWAKIGDRGKSLRIR